MRKKIRRLGGQIDSIKMLSYANRYVGMQFKRNPPPLEIDCSSFTQMVFAKVGLRLPRTSQEQAKHGKAVNKADLHPGDLIFYHIPDRNPIKGSVGHVAIYAGRGSTSEADTTRKVE
ncbi:C40 family peptidase [Paenibacillus sp. MMO-58]|uniref:C40 family peptidase n=1 Tax=Paenibacillus sp. MMO-58 TaxID=3081290 RepID=UPI0030178E24